MQHRSAEFSGFRQNWRADYRVYIQQLIIYLDSTLIQLGSKTKGR